MALQVDGVILTGLIKPLAVLYAVEVQRYKELKQDMKNNQVVVNLFGVVTWTALNVPHTK